MQITRSKPNQNLSYPKAQSATPEQPPQEPKDTFVSRHSENILGLTGLAGSVAAGAVTASQFSMGMSGFVGMLVGMAAGAVTGAGAGLVASEAFLKAYPLDPANEIKKYTALTRGAGAFVGGLAGAVAGGIAGFCGAAPWAVAPAAVLGGAASSGLMSAGLKLLK